MSNAKEIHVANVKLTIDNESEIFTGMKPVWEFFKWDIENDPNAKECSLLITRELSMHGHVDLNVPNHKVSLDLIPVE